MGCMDGIGPMDGFNVIAEAAFRGASLGMGMGIAGTVGELLAKQIDEEAHPNLRAVAITTAKVVQVAGTALLLVVTAALATWFHPVALGAGILIGSVMILTPPINALIQAYGNESMKKMAAIADQAVSLAAKVINTLAVTLTAFAFLDVGAAGVVGVTLVGLTMGALNIATWMKN